MRTLKNNKLESFSIIFFMVVLLWDYIITDTIFASENLERLVYAVFLLSFTFCLFKTKGVKLSPVQIVWLPYIIFTLLGAFFTLSIQRFAYWYAILIIVLIPTIVSNHAKTVFNLIFYSGLIVLAGVYFQFLLPNIHNKIILPFFSNNDSLFLEILSWQEIGYGYVGITSQLGVASVMIIIMEGVLIYVIKPRNSQRYSILFTALILLSIVGVFLTGKRTLAICALIIPLIIPALGKKRDLVFILFPLVAIIVYFAYDFFVSNVYHFADDPILGRFARSYIEQQQGEDITSGRRELYRDAINAFMDHPILGVGDFKKYTGNLIAPHNTFLQVLCEQGIVGMLLYIVPVVYCLRACIKKLKYVKRGNGIFEFVVFIQLVYVFYSLTGNTNVNLRCYGIYFVTISIFASCMCNLELKRNNYKEHESRNINIPSGN